MKQVALLSPLIVLVLLLVASAFMTAQAVCRPQYPWLGWVALLPIFAAVAVLRPWGAAVAGAFWGLCLACFSSGWAFGTIALAPWPILLLITIPAIYSYVASAISRRFGFNPFILGVGWILVELALGPVGLKHGLLASTQHDGTLAGWIGQSFGYVFVPFLIAVANAAVLLILGGLRLKIAGLRRRIIAQVVLRGVSPRTFFSHPCFCLCEARPRAPPLCII